MKLQSRQSGGRAHGGHRSQSFKIWLTTSAVWIIAIVTTIYAGGVFPVGYQANFPLRIDLESWNDEWPIDGPLRRPLYEIIRSPAAEKLSLTFQWRGYSTGRWNEHIHARDLPRFSFPGGETLDLPADLTDADREYVKQAFWDQRWKRSGDTLGPFARSAIFVPLGFFVILWLARRFKIARSGKELEPEPPRLPYSPAMERLRVVTLVVSAIEILLWLVIAVLNDREDPQALGDVLSIMFVAMLPANLSFIMSLLRRGPLTAAALAALAFWMLLPQLTVRIAPPSQPPGNLKKRYAALIRSVPHGFAVNARYACNTLSIGRRSSPLGARIFYCIFESSFRQPTSLRWRTTGKQRPSR